MTHTHVFEDIEVWGVSVCRCGFQTTAVPELPAKKSLQASARQHLCGITDCTERGEWREHPSRFDRSKTLRLFLCDEHHERMLKRAHQHAIEFPSTARLEDSIASHPASYDSIGGRVSFKIWLSHADECRCEHCSWTSAHLDDEDDTQRNAVWT